MPVSMFAAGLRIAPIILFCSWGAAVQDAYAQGLISRKRITEKNAVFRNENGEKITISDDIDEAYILIVTTENYPSLTHQSRTLLEKEDNDPHPLVSRRHRPA